MKSLKPIDLSPRGSDTAHALAWGLIAAAALIVGIVVGSRGFKDFDPALVSYAGATVFSAFGLGYRYSMWLRRPPTRLYWFRGWQIFLQPKRLPGNLARLAGIFWNSVVLQRFIERRSKTRWTAHWFLAWGCLIAAAVTFPLIVRVDTLRDRAGQSGRSIAPSFSAYTSAAFRSTVLMAPLAFNILDICAVMVLIGVFTAMWRRGRDRGAMSVQQFSNDLLPLILLFAISVTGLFLTVSTHLMRGLHYVLSLATARRDRYLHAALFAVWKVLPHLSASRADGHRLLQTCRRRRRTRQCVPVVDKAFARSLQIGDLKAVQSALEFSIEWKTARTTRMFVRNAGARISPSPKMRCGGQPARSASA